MPAEDGTNRTFGPCLPGQAILSGNQLKLTSLEPGQAVKVLVRQIRVLASRIAVSYSYGVPPSVVESIHPKGLHDMLLQVYTPPNGINETCDSRQSNTLPYSWTVRAGGETVRCLNSRLSAIKYPGMPQGSASGIYFESHKPHRSQGCIRCALLAFS